MIPVESHLVRMLADISRDAACGNWKSASRLADCARRFVPNDSAIQLLCSRVFLQQGAGQQAEQCIEGREDLDALIVRAEAWLMRGEPRQSAALCQQLLQQYCVSAVGGLARVAAGVCGVAGYPGWVGLDDSLRLTGEVQVGAPLTVSWANRAVSINPVVRTNGSNRLSSFVYELPREFTGPVTVDSRGHELLGSGLQWPPAFGPAAGWVVLEDDELQGEVRLDWAPNLPLTVIIAVADEEIRHIVVPENGRSAGVAFSFPLSKLPFQASSVDVSVLLPSGLRQALQGSPLETRALPTERLPIAVRPQRPLASVCKTQCRLIDVVVPVYAGYDETMQCLESVLSAGLNDQIELVVVNDASPDARLTAALRALSASGRITLLTNPVNMGFPATANCGIRLHPDRDVVLLNSDTQVFGDWVERLRRAAYGAADVATVTPLGQAASITSYPYSAQSTAADQTCTPEEAQRIDEIARRVNAGRTVDLPTGVGFCMYLRRDCLNEVGDLDEKTFSKGYGEENDFCLRARNLGWRHLAATDLFVWHQGGRSFGPMKQTLMARNARVLNERYPGYASLVSEFIASDALRTARQAIDMQRLLAAAVEPVLLLTVDLSGGVARHVDERESRLTAAGHTVFVIRCAEVADPSGRVTLSTRSEFRGTVDLTFYLPDELSVLREFLLAAKLTGVEIHHFLGSGAQLLGIVTELGVSYRIYVHDYSWVCPRVTLMGGEGVYCGEPSLSSCEECIATHGSALGESLTVAALRARSSRIFHSAAEVIVPSQDVCQRLTRYFPELHFRVVPWEEPAIPTRRQRPPMEKRIRVAVIGAISRQKGYSILQACARDAAERNLALDFIVIGYTCGNNALLESGRVFVTGPYKEEEVDDLLQREQCHVAFFPSVTPETWCYCLTHALRSALPVIAFDLGAIAERLRNSASQYKLLPLTTTPPDINDIFLTHRSDPEKEPLMNTAVPQQEHPKASDPTASVEVLTLPEGIYAFTVRGGAVSQGTSNGLVLPALQVAAAPAKSAGTIEFLSGPGTYDRWLARSGDVVTAKISGGSASLLLTSVRSQDSSILAIDVRKLDVKDDATADTEPPTAQSGSSQESRLSNDPGAHQLPIRVLVHVQNTGDLQFTDSWAGRADERLWIEAFTVTCLEPDAADLIQYRGVTADGFATPWLSNDLLCGSRGRGMPLTGFAIRMKPEMVDRYGCVYRGKFASGVIAGPFDDARLCRSDTADDPLVGIEMSVVRREAATEAAAV